ncbi:MAG: hypothetical protein KatS3mg008_0474 [Acidimicrobiales bacterium]|nr:MAG: hypothetical protein KatS3mg008_0474 [Acidimicrobiales bacterium]
METVTGDRLRTVRSGLSSSAQRVTELLVRQALRRNPRCGTDANEDDAHRLSVAAVLVAWSPAETVRCATALRETLETTGARWRLVVVAQRPMDLPPELDVLEGDNSFREFSGWKVGLDAIARDERPDVVVLANDRFGSYRYDHLRYMDAAVLRLIAETDALTGAINHYPREVHSLGHDLSAWVRTNLFATTPSCLERVGGPILPELLQLDARVPRDWPGGLELPREAGVSELHQRLLRSYLTGSGEEPFRRLWHRARPASADWWPELRAKVLCVLAEQLLSARCREAGSPVMDFRTARILTTFYPEDETFRRTVLRLSSRDATEAVRVLSARGQLALALRALLPEGLR